MNHLCAHCYWLIKQVFPKNNINNFFHERTRGKPIFCERSYWIWPNFWWKKLYGILRCCFWPHIDAPHTIAPQIALSPRFSVCMLYLLTWVVHLVWWAERSNLKWNITLQAWASIQMISNPWKSKQCSNLSLLPFCLYRPLLCKNRIDALLKSPLLPL